MTGRYNAFPTNTTGTDSTTLSVGLDTSTAVAGLKTGSVVIDNLDVTNGSGLGEGNQDGDDTINVTLDVLDPSEASFSGLADNNTLLIDLGTVAMGSTLPTVDFDIFNLESTSGYTADLELDSIFGSGDTSALTTDLTTFTGLSALAAGSSNMFTATLETSSTGIFSATYTLEFSDENIAGASMGDDLILTLIGEVTPGGNADFDSSGEIDGLDYLTLQRGFGGGTTFEEGDADGNGVVDGADLIIWENQYGSSSIASSVAAVPEPNSALLLSVALVWLSSRRRQI